jgi:hypothetical protein
MLTRQWVYHSYAPVQPAQVNVPGFVRVTMAKGIPQTWAVVRPGSGPAPDDCPHYLGFHSRTNEILYGGHLALTMGRPNLEMDPSDPTTWQRDYKFTN